MNHYQILQLRRHVSTNEVRDAYLRLAHQWHPDLNRHDVAAKERFKQIRQAYEVLRRPELRSAYDRQLAVTDRAAQRQRHCGDTNPVHRSGPIGSTKSRDVRRKDSVSTRPAAFYYQSRCRDANVNPSRHPESPWTRNSCRDWSLFAAMVGGAVIAITVIILGASLKGDRQQSVARQAPTFSTTVTRQPRASSSERLRSSHGVDNKMVLERVANSHNGWQGEMAVATPDLAERSEVYDEDLNQLTKINTLQIDEEIWSELKAIHQAVADLSTNLLSTHSLSFYNTSVGMKPMSVQRLEYDAHLLALSQRSDGLTKSVDVALRLVENKFRDQLDLTMGNGFQPMDTIPLSRRLTNNAFAGSARLNNSSMEPSQSWEAELSLPAGQREFEWTLSAAVEFAPTEQLGTKPSKLDEITEQPVRKGLVAWQKQTRFKPLPRKMTGWTDPNASTAVTLYGSSLTGVDRTMQGALKPLIPAKHQKRVRKIQQNANLPDLLQTDSFGTERHGLARPTEPTIDVMAELPTLPRRRVGSSLVTHAWDARIPAAHAF